MELNIFTLTQRINECVISDLIDLKGFIYSVQSKETYEMQRKTLHFRKQNVKDQTGIIPTVLFSSVKEKVSNNRWHPLKKLEIQKFMDVHLLNLMETITVSENESVKIFVSDDDNNVFSY